MHINGQFPATVSLSSLNGEQGFVLNPTSYGGGTWLASGGDINGDGIDDIIIGYPGLSSPGSVFVVFGTTYWAPVDFSNLNGVNGFEINGIGAFDAIGYAVGLGDLNGDGLSDIIFSSNEGYPTPGKVYVIFGSSNLWPGVVSLSSLNLNGTTGLEFTSTLASGEVILGASLEGTGDVNGDGIQDLIMGDPYASSNAGRMYVVFGSRELWTSPFPVSNLNGTNGFRIDGDAYTNTGSAVASGGDVNGDGIQDIIIGAWNTTGGGSAYVIFGRSTWNSNFSLDTIDGSNGFIVKGRVGFLSPPSDFIPFSIKGDINGDGVQDLILGDSPYTGNFNGKIYVLFGKQAFWQSQISLLGLNFNGTNGFEIVVGAGGSIGPSVSTADINHNGIEDIIIGQAGAGSTGLYNYILFGKTTRPNSTSLNSLDSVNAFGVEKSPSSSTPAIVSYGDVNIFFQYHNESERLSKL